MNIAEDPNSQIFPPRRYCNQRLDWNGTKPSSLSMNQTSSHRRPPQISIAFMMMLMLIFSFISAGLFYASRVPAIQNEISMFMTGQVTDGSEEEAGRMAQIAFVMFTYTSPLLLAGAISISVTALRWYERRR